MHDKKHDDYFDDKTPDSAEQELLSLLDTYDAPKVRDYKAGDAVTGTVTRIGAERVYIDLDGKVDGILKRNEVEAKDGSLSLEPGQNVDAYVASVEGGVVTLTTSFSGLTASPSELRTAMESRLPVQGKVTGINKGGLQVKVMGVVGFCPASQVEMKYVEDLNTYLSRSLSFAIVRMEGRRVVLSRIPLLEQDLSEQLDALTADLEAKKVRSGAITRIADYGLFVDTGCGIDGMAHVSEVSWSRADNLSESFSIGQQVQYVVKSIERREPLRSTKISLSLKQATGDPWDGVADRFQAGTLADGAITRCAPFGAFVQLAPGVEGLIHISELSWDRRVRRADDVVKPEQQVRVTILSVDERARKISCSLKDMENDPWKDAATHWPVGSSVSGTVSSRTKYGYFIDLSDGVTGLLAMPNISRDKRNSVRVGEQTEVTITNVDPERRRISLSLGLEQSADGSGEAEEYMQRESATSESNPSSEFGDALKAALEKKKRK